MVVRHAAPEKRLRVDANAAWTAKHAVRMSEFLAEQGVEMIEQPVFNLFYPCGLPLDKLDDYP